MTDALPLFPLLVAIILAGCVDARGVSPNGDGSNVYVREHRLADGVRCVTASPREYSDPRSGVSITCDWNHRERY